MIPHLRILDFALVCLWRQKWRQGANFLLYGLVVFGLSSLLLLTAALKQEARLLLAGTPALTVQRISAGRHDWIPLTYAETIASIPGVRGVSARYWGYYYDPPPNATYTLMGVEALPLKGTQLWADRGFGTATPWACVIGQGVATARLLEVDDLLPIKGSDGALHALRITDLFSADSALLTQDFVLLRIEAWRRIFDVPPNVATDLAVEVPNAKEADTVTRKVMERLPDVRVLGRENLVRTYDAVFDWRGSMVMLAWSGALAAFGIVAFERASSLGAEERRTLGVLKAIGWNAPEILALKVWEALSLSLTAFLVGTLAAHLHVFHGGAAGLVFFLKGWSVLFPELHLQPHDEPLQLLVVFMLSVVPYLLATLVPAWTAAAVDPDQILHS